MIARTTLWAEAGGRIRWRATPPLVPRRTGPDEVHLVGAAGGPLGGDELTLEIQLAADAQLTIRSAAATIVQPGDGSAGPARLTVRAQLAAGARLHWCPQPTVVCDEAELHTSLRLELAEGASALVHERIILGRHGERGGRYRGELRIDHAGAALLRHTSVLDGVDPGLSGPAGTAGHRSLTTLCGVGGEPRPTGCSPNGERNGLRWATHQLAGPGWLRLALGGTCGTRGTRR